MTAQQILVGIADIQISKGETNLVCLGLGSCIGLLFHEPMTKISGMVHIMLPESFPNKPVDKVGKFANTGVEALLNQMISAGASKSRLKVAYAGGAQVFKFGNSTSTGSNLDIGLRNAEAVKKELIRLGLRADKIDVGGNSGRTVTFDAKTGDFRVKTVTTGEKLLCNLK